MWKYKMIIINSLLKKVIISFVVLSVITNIIRLKLKKEIDDLNEKIKKFVSYICDNKINNNLFITNVPKLIIK